MVSVGVSIDLPLFAKHRQDPIIAARAEQANSARLEREATARAVRAQLDADLAEHRAHHERYMRATNTQIGTASCRERVCQYVLISAVPVSITKKPTTHYIPTIQSP